MKYKFILIFLLFIIIKISYNFVFPTVKIVNHTDNVIRVTKGEFNNKNSDPELDEVEDMLNNIVYMKPNESHSYNISVRSIITDEKIRVDVSYEKERLVLGRSFMIGDSGSCKYKINVYDDYADIETNGLNICYKKLFMVKVD